MIFRIFGKIVDSVQQRRDPVAWARSLGVTVGDRCRLLQVNRATFGSEPYLVRLGDHVTVTSEVRFVTHDGGVWVFRDEHPDIDLIRPIEVRDNVFLGMRSTILPGVTIGRNSIVAAGAVVAKNVPEGSVVAGVPARVVQSVDAYFEKHRPDFLYVRSMPPSEKRLYLQRLFDRASGDES